MQRSWAAGTIALIAGVAVLAAGCGASGSVAAPAQPASTSAATTGRADSARFAKFTECLRSHGVTRVPGFGGQSGQTPSGGQRPTLSDSERATLEQAFAACRSLAPQGGFQFGGRGRNSPQFAKYRQCMAQHGAKLPLPGSGQRPDFTSKQFRAATQACGNLLAQPGATTNAQ